VDNCLNFCFAPLSGGSLLEFFKLAEDEVLGPAGGGDDPIGHGLAEFFRGGACFLRDREVFLQSVGAPHRHGAGDPDQLPGPDIENFGIFVVEHLLPDIHGESPFS
jgi:hypothetical protein